jgi:hypothetical protein
MYFDREEIEHFAGQLPKAAQHVFREAVSNPGPADLRDGIERLEEVAFVAGRPQAFLILTARYLYVVRPGSVMFTDGKPRPLIARLEGADLVVGQGYGEERLTGVTPLLAAKRIARKVVDAQRLPRVPGHAPAFNPLTARW